MIDVVEAIFGAGEGVDTHLGDIEEQIAVRYPDRQQWGFTEAQMRAQAKMEAMFGGNTEEETPAPTVTDDATRD